MRHADARSRLSEYLEGDLSERDEARVRDHLHRCAECRAELRELRVVVAALRELPPAEPPGDLAAQVRARLLAGEGRSLRTRVAPWLERLSIAWVPPVAAAIGIGAIAWLEPQGPASDPRRPVFPRAAVAQLASPTPAPAPAAAAAPPGAGALPSITSCLEGAPAGDASADACARWYSWFVAMALEDTRGFVHEVERLPVGARDPWLRRVSEFARRSGSAPLVGQELRKSRDPRAAVIASRFEQGAPVRRVGWAGR